MKIFFTTKKHVVYLLIVLIMFIISSYAIIKPGKPPEIKKLKFGSITVNGKVYDHDLLIEKGEVKKRKKGPSQELINYGHTPLSELEYIPWDCDTLVIGIGMSSKLPVTDKLKEIAKQKNVTLILLRTPEAVEFYTKNYSLRVNSVFHITC